MERHIRMEFIIVVAFACQPLRVNVLCHPMPESTTTKSSTRNPDFESALKRSCVGCNLPREPSDAEREETERRERLEFVKTDLLSKLQLSQPPQTSVERRRIPQAVVDEFLRESERQSWTEEKRDNVLILSKPVRALECSTQDCVAFTYKHVSDESTITASTLWLYLKPSSSKENGGIDKLHVSVTAIGRGSVKHGKELLSATLAPGTLGWTAVTISNPSAWLTALTPGLQKIDVSARISCSSCKVSTELGFQPFLVVEKKTSLLQRSQRSSECDKGGGCCLDSFVVDMKEIGWSDWIMVPDRYDAKYCHGSCVNSTDTREHTAFIQGVARKKRQPIKQCCTATEFKPLHVLYVNNDNVLMKTTIRNLIASKCECS